ncbi:helix-turn-helix domain-containing protein [Micromonospora sp. RTGN7]|uniref:helix-turn-helix domain-containing protein n=1 Tax=Micromonospora sp. RTGN7 TaxID=3016526 RepID=UPI0029FEE57F|nr:helix-turn-helix domain-containing protein [Micromonospora sp. RTGN7]
MSQHVKAALAATKGLGKNERLVAVAIAAHMNKAGDAWPSIATIAEYADCSERTVQRAIAKLITAGRIAWRKVADIATRVYRLVTAAVQGVPTSGPGVTNDSTGVPNGSTGGDSQGDTRSSEESLKEKPRVRADWRRFIPKNKATTTPERRGVPSPPQQGTVRWCPTHRGSPAHNCGPCRSEALARGAR